MPIMETRYFDIGKTPCKAYLPESGQAAYAVLAVHGFGSSKESPTVESLANAMCPDGAAVYCFDFPAHGTHPDGGESFAVQACADTLLSVARYVREAHGQSVGMGVFASSFGGYMTLRCLDGLSEILGDGYALVLRAPAVKMADTLGQVIVADQMDELERQGAIEVGFARKFEMRASFLDELRERDVCIPHDRPMLVIHGTADDIVPPSDIDEFMAQNPLAQLVRVPGAGHVLEGEEQIAMGMGAAREYFLGPVE